MASSITSLGSATGMDMESIVQALVSEKKTSLYKQVTARKQDAQIEISGVATLKSKLSSLQTNLKSLLDESAFNQRWISTNQGNDGVFTIAGKDDIGNASFSLAVTQLAQSEKASRTFTAVAEGEEGFHNSFNAGTITLSLGVDEDGNERQFSVEVAEGDSLESIRRRINKNDLGISANLVKTTSGYALSLDAGATGADKTRLSVTTADQGGDKDSLSLLNFDGGATVNTDANGAKTKDGWNYTAGQDAKILVDGAEVTSNTNTFDGQVAGMKITVNRVSPDETTTVGGTEVTGKKTYNVDVTKDTAAMTSKMKSFITAYNSTITSLNALYKQNTYTDGKSNEDGGDLAGDSETYGIKRSLQNMVSSFSKSENGMTVYGAGLKFNNDGTLGLDESKFTKAVSDNYNDVMALFTGDSGLFSQMDNYVNEYTKTAGNLQSRTDALNKTLKYYEQREDSNSLVLTKYEETLRQKYANLDTMMSNSSNQLSYLNQVISGMGSQKK